MIRFFCFCGYQRKNGFLKMQKFGFANKLRVNIKQIIDAGKAVIMKVPKYLQSNKIKPRSCRLFQQEKTVKCI